MAFQLRRQATGSDFLPLHLHRVVAISCALRDRDSFRVWSLGAEADGEAVLIQRFFDGIAKYTPQLVSWNGGGFDLPVLHYRGLMHGVKARRYWDMGDDDREFRYNNYISRYHLRHLRPDGPPVALPAARQRAARRARAAARACPASSAWTARRCGTPISAGSSTEIRRYCETDVVNTYLVFLRFQLMREALTAEQHRAECELVRDDARRRRRSRTGRSFSRAGAPLHNSCCD